MQIYIGNLRKGISVKELSELFSHVGEIAEIEIIRANASDIFGKDFAILHLVPKVKRALPKSLTYSVNRQ